jgi:hypothetical protein
MSRVAAFGKFLWSFVIGDDWRVALAVAVALAVTLLLADNRVAAWWLLPVVVGAVLSLSVWRAARDRT